MPDVTLIGKITTGSKKFVIKRDTIAFMVVFAMVRDWQNVYGGNNRVFQTVSRRKVTERNGQAEEAAITNQITAYTDLARRTAPYIASRAHACGTVS